MLQRSRMGVAVALALATISMARAEDALGPVTVTATRTSAALGEVPASVTAIEGKDIERRLPADESDLFKDEPDISFSRDLRRFGATRVNIRGIEDNRVTSLVDGVRLPDFYNSGGPTNFTMSASPGVPIDFLKQVEILRGPASSLYGSDAIGGVVGYLTLDPSDLLAKDAAFGGRYRIGYNGANDGLTNTLLGAWQANGVQALLGYTRTRASEFENQGDDGRISASRTKPNPQDVDDQGVMAKLYLRPAQGHRLGFTLEGREQDADVTVRRLAASLPKVTAMDGNDNGRRVRGSVEWEHMPQGAFYDRMVARVYHQDADTRNDNIQTRTNTSATCSASSGTGNNCLIDQEFKMSQTSTGGSLQFESAIKSAAAEHLLSYGLDLSRVKTDEMRDATIYNLTTGGVSKSLAGETFPSRDFAVGRTDTIGLFVQDEITGLADGRLSLVPGLRYDRRKLSPDVDSLARNTLDAIGRTAVEKTESAFSPKFGALWRASSGYSLYAQVARGFRAPNYDEVNGAFRNTAQGYGTTPNPDLKPETSVGVEMGVKLHMPTLRGQFAVYDNRYKDFIENVMLGCPSDPRCITGLRSTYTSVNLSKARIYGAEMRTAWDFMPGWKLDGALAYAHGENESTGQPLNSVEPLRASIGLGRDAGRWGAEGRLRAAAAVKRTDDSEGEWFRPGGYGVTDLAFWLRPAKGVQINLAVNNLFDKKYWLWSDIRQADAQNPLGVDFYSQAGRTLSASLSYQF